MLNYTIYNVYYSSQLHYWYRIIFDRLYIIFYWIRKQKTKIKFFIRVIFFVMANQWLRNQTIFGKFFKWVFWGTNKIIFKSIKEFQWRILLNLLLKIKENPYFFDKYDWLSILNLLKLTLDFDQINEIWYEFTDWIDHQ